MRILNKDTDAKVDRIIIYLTKSEANELKDSIVGLLENPESNHEHVSSSDYQKELTITIYDEKNISNKYDQRSIKLIKEDI